MPLNIIRNDISKIPCDAIVNAANKSLLGGGGVDGAIHKAAGIGLFFDCLKLRGCKVGDAKITPAHKLPCKYVIHTVGPKWKDGTHGEAELLADCYLKSLTLAKEYECESVAFPLISTGVYKFPKAEALKIAVDTISKFLEDNEMEVTIVVYEKSDFKIGKDFDDRLSKFIVDKYKSNGWKIDFEAYGIGDSYLSSDRPLERRSGSIPGRYQWEETVYVSSDDIDERLKRSPSRRKSHAFRAKPSKFVRRKRRLRIIKRSSSENNIQIDAEKPIINIAPTIDQELPMSATAELDISAILSRLNKTSDSSEVIRGRFHEGSGAVSEQRINLDEKLLEKDESFTEALLRMIDERGMKDSECYKKANVDRRLFSKIRSDQEYHPRKTTAIAFAIALELNYKDTQEFIGKAGYTLTHSSKLDLVVEFFIQENNYNIGDINRALFARDLSLLGEMSQLR